MLTVSSEKLIQNSDQTPPSCCASGIEGETYN